MKYANQKEVIVNIFIPIKDIKLILFFEVYLCADLQSSTRKPIIKPHKHKNILITSPLTPPLFDDQTHNFHNFHFYFFGPKLRYKLGFPLLFVWS